MLRTSDHTNRRDSSTFFFFESFFSINKSTTAIICYCCRHSTVKACYIATGILLVKSVYRWPYHRKKEKHSGRCSNNT